MADPIRAARRLAALARGCPVARSRATIGQRFGPRLTDVGDDWRSLLLGAPPGLVPSHRHP